jgi:hypothetical protein
MTSTTSTTELQKLKAEKAPVKDWAAIIANAFKQAAEAAAGKIEEDELMGLNTWYPCGFAWVNIKPARGPLVAYLKSIGEGYTDEYYGGYTVYNPSKNHTQWMDAKKAGARAFADELKIAGIQCTVGTRMD